MKSWQEMDPRERAEWLAKLKPRGLPRPIFPTRVFERELGADKPVRSSTTTVHFQESFGGTDRAERFLLPSGVEKWIPKSVIEDRDDQACVLMVKSWWCTKEGLDDGTGT